MMVLLFYDAADADIKLSGIMTSFLHKYRPEHQSTVIHD